MASWQWKKKSVDPNQGQFESAHKTYIVTCESQCSEPTQHLRCLLYTAVYQQSYNIQSVTTTKKYQIENGTKTAGIRATTTTTGKHIQERKRSRNWLSVRLTTTKQQTGIDQTMKSIGPLVKEKSCALAVISLLKWWA